MVGAGADRVDKKADIGQRDRAGAVAACRAADLRIVVITGDHPDTGLARAIVRRAGIGAGEVLTGSGSRHWTPKRWRAGVDVCARIAPQQKLDEFENEPPEKDLMRRPLRAPGASLSGREAVVSARAQGIGICNFDLRQTHSGMKRTDCAP